MHNPSIASRAPNLAAFAKANPDVLKELRALRKIDKSAAIRSQTVRNTLFYWSRCRLNASVVAGNNVTFTAVKSQCFSYPIGQPMAAAGLSALGNATEAETNLEQANTTISGETVKIVGIGAQLAPDTDGEVAKLLFPHIACRIVRANGAPVRLGPISMLPGAGGLFGSAASKLVEPPLGQATVERGVVSNGYPSGLNYRALEEPVMWTPVGTADGIVTLEFELVRSIVIPIPVARSAAAGIAAYVQPTLGQPGTFLDILGLFITEATGPRSVVR